MQQDTVNLHLQSALHVLGGISTQYLALLRTLLLPVVSVTVWELQFPYSHAHDR